MSKPATVAIVGAGGCVGREMLELLHDASWVSDELQLYGSERSRGKSIEFRGRTLPVRVLGDGPIEPCDVALFAAGGSVSREWAHSFVEAGASVIDNSSAFRLDPNVPLVVPEINGDAIPSTAGIIANPNCSTIILLLGIEPLRQLGSFQVVASTYQAVSGAGQAGLDALERERGALDCGIPEQGTPNEVTPKQGAFEEGNPFPFPIEGNLFPLIGDPSDDEAAITVEERKMVDESRKILDDPSLKVFVTCVRVPVERCHSESVTLFFDRAEDADLERAIAVLESAPGITLIREADQPPTPLVGRKAHDVFVGRVRKPAPGVLQLWLVGDQLLKGAALNAVQIAEKVVAGGFSG